MSLPLSVFLIARDEAARLPATLDALGFADEVVLLDSGSTDATLEIARARGARVEQRPFEGYGAQKAHAEALCRHDWVLNLDADEVVSPALAAEIRGLFAGGLPAPGAWRVRILTVYPGDAAPRPFANDYNVVRLYHRAAGSYSTHPLFDRVTLTGGVRPGQLRAPVHHHAITSWAHFVEKENRYTTFQAQTARARPRWRLLLRLPVEMPLAFLKFYILRRHVSGGWKGFAFAMIAAFGRTLRLAKMLERAGRGSVTER
jgi:glycosyltransferase involved in cell wall biosynthesis